MTQATPRIKASRIGLSQSATRTHTQGQHHCLIARHDIIVAFFHAAGSGRVVVTPFRGDCTTSTPRHCRASDHRRSAGTDRRTAPRQDIRWTSQGIVWEANEKHVDDTIASVGLNPDSNGAPALSMTATGKGRRVNEEELEPSAAQTFTQAARTGLYLPIDRPSIRFVMSTVRLQVMLVARCVLDDPTERWVHDYHKDPKGLFGRGLGGGRGHQELSAMASTCSTAAFPNTRRSPNHRARPKSTA